MKNRCDLDDLLPCPFCGNKDHMFTIFDDKNVMYQIECEPADESHYIEICSWESKEDAIKTWNTRK